MVRESDCLYHVIASQRLAITFFISSARASAFSIVSASLYIRMIGSVFDLRRCTQLSGKSIFTPSMSVIFSLENFTLTASRIASTSISGVRLYLVLGNGITWIASLKFTYLLTLLCKESEEESHAHKGITPVVKPPDKSLRRCLLHQSLRLASFILVTTLTSPTAAALYWQPCFSVTSRSAREPTEI